MFKNTNATNAQEYIDSLQEPRKSEIMKIHEFILNTLPNIKPYIIAGIIGYGKGRYKTKAGKEGEWFLIGLASQKNYISIYSCAVKDGQYLAEKHKDILGKASIGRSCIRYKKLQDIPWDSLKKVLIESSQVFNKDGIFNYNNE